MSNRAWAIATGLAVQDDPHRGDSTICAAKLGGCSGTRVAVEDAHEAIAMLKP